MKLPTGKSTSIPLRLCCVAPNTLKKPRSCPRRSGTAIDRLPERNWPVTEPFVRSTLFAVPSATTWPPCSPAPGPMSTSQSALRIICSSCSTTSTVFPRSRSRTSVSISRPLSRWCSPIDGPSRMYSTPKSCEPVRRARRRPCAAPADAVAVLHIHALAACAVEEEVALVLRQVVPGRVGIDLVALADRADYGLVEARVADRPRHERPVGDGDGAVRHEQVGVDLLLRPEPRAARARSVRRVEREDARLQLGQRDAVVGTREVLAEQQLLPFVHEVHADEALGELRRRLDRLPQPRAQVRLHHEPVDDDLDRVLVLLVEDDLVLEQLLLAVDLDAREALAAHLLEHVAELALTVAHDRRIDREARAVR